MIHTRSIEVRRDRPRLNLRVGDRRSNGAVCKMTSCSVPSHALIQMRTGTLRDSRELFVARELLSGPGARFLQLVLDGVQLAEEREQRRRALHARVLHVEELAARVRGWRFWSLRA